MHRRRFIATATATIASASAAGCSGILGDGGGSSGPGAAVKAYIRAAADGDEDRLERYTHPEGNVADSQARGTPADASISIDSTETIRQADGEATVAVTVTATQGAQSNTVEYEFDVRKHDGTWTVYDFSLVG